MSRIVNYYRTTTPVKSITVTAIVLLGYGAWTYKYPTGILTLPGEWFWNGYLLLRRNFFPGVVDYGFWILFLVYGVGVAVLVVLLFKSVSSNLTS